MESIDPATGQALPADAIQRVLFVARSVHVYNIPPMVPGKGHVAASWTADGNKRQIFTARLRVIETAIPTPSGDEKMKTDLVLEDSSSGQLYAAAPYTVEAVVEQVSDSSRFFAVRVQDPEGRKASLGVGFEERSEAFDFSVALQEARKTLGWDQGGGQPGKKPAVKKKDSAEKRDYSLKEGETITVSLPGRSAGRRRPTADAPANTPLSAFSLPPPPSASSSRGSDFLPPPPAPGPSSKGSGSLPPSSAPPSTQNTRVQHSSNTQGPGQPSAEELGFDDGKFGEFA
ncbi:uncharacterized protein BCR38DRAFT_435902 [Pseudomassariella vexata]|uniref:NECAP PHear domain-containing protein n=1 Tax=Pseudomassariella vexata TaxID=1141098 RepID=A0A1Y2DV17_9PEZI|nr:uncharacterized protein BCR38DRAFT_435902 [Pseudomassariella vexata]ORY63111.1 hypothetical protein BCR38DRAFT_435902 [Pseudomassariella vexata]